MPSTGNATDYKTTLYNVLSGAANNLLNNIAPSATSGVPLISQGSAAQPVFGTALVAGGGTGSTSFNINGVVISGLTGLNPLTALTLTNGQVVIGATGGAPVAGTLTAGLGISIVNGANSITISASAVPLLLTFTVVTHAQSPYTVLAADEFLEVDTTGGAVTILLPNAPTTGRSIIIKDYKGNFATHNTSVSTVGGVVVIDGQTTYTLVSNYSSITVTFDSVSYNVY